MKFIGLIKEIKQKRTGLDNEYLIQFITDDKMIMSLSGIPSDENVIVVVEGEHERPKPTKPL